MTLMNVMTAVEYRGAYFVFMLDAVLVPIISLLVWLTVSEAGVQLPYSRSQFVTYYVLLSIVSMLTGTWLGEYLAQDIRLGGLSRWLVPPGSGIAYYATNNAGEKVMKLPLLLPLVALTALLFRGDLRLPADPISWLLFITSLPLAAVVSFLIQFDLGSLAFWIQDANGLLRATGLIGTFLAGKLIPLALFPHSFAGFLDAQPFRYTASFPLEILTGGLARSALAEGFAWQIGYCAGLWLCYRLHWHYGLRSYSAVGA